MIKQRDIYGCTECGTIFYVGARKVTETMCISCKSPDVEKIEGFKSD